MEVWNFKYIGGTEKQFTVKSSIFEVTVPLVAKQSYSSDAVKPVLEVSEDIVLKANEFIKENIPKLMNAACEDKLTLEMVQNLVSPNAPKGRDIEIFEKCKKATTTYLDRKYRNIEITQVIPHLTEKSQWVSDDSFYLAMGISTTWEDPSVTTQTNWTHKSSDKYADIVLEYVNEEFKIVDIDPKLDKYSSGLWDVFNLNSSSDDF